jgi:hypothetical protein
MQPFQPKASAHDGPESKIQKAIVKYLREREWFVKETHGNAFQSGFPDTFATHSKWLGRWVEIKYGYAFSFTPQQIIDFPKFQANGTQIYILSEATDEEYAKLFKPSNFVEYFHCFHDGCRDIYAWRGGRRTTPISERKSIDALCGK